MIFRSCFVYLLILMPMQAEYVGLRIANALDHGRGSLRVVCDGREWFTHGIQRGEVSGLRRLQPGVHHLKFTRNGLDPAEIRLRLKSGECVSLVPYARRRDNGQWAIRVLKLDVDRLAVDREVSIVYVGARPRLLLDFQPAGKDWESLVVNRMELEAFTVSQPRGYLPVRVGRQTLQSLPIFEQGRQVMVVFDLVNGGLSSLSYRSRSWPIMAPLP